MGELQNKDKQIKMESTNKNIVKVCIGLLEPQAIVELYEYFNGGTFDNESFNQWIKEFI